MNWLGKNYVLKSFHLLVFLFVFNGCKTFNNNISTFVQLCDTQLGMGGYEHDVKTFNQAVKQINVLKPDFVVICGDLVNEANDSSYYDFQNILNKIDAPTFLAPGNHDVGNTPDSISLKYYRAKIGKDYYAFESNNTNFVVVNTQLWKVNVPVESEQHQRWFEHSLDSLNNSNNPIFVIGHYPLYTVNYDEEEHYFNIPKPLRKNILDVMVKSKVKAYLSGHKHELIENSYNNILLLSGESTSKNFDGRPLGFRLWTLKGRDSIQHRFIKLDSF